MKADKELKLRQTYKGASDKMCEHFCKITKSKISYEVMSESVMDMFCHTVTSKQGRVGYHKKTIYFIFLACIYKVFGKNPQYSLKIPEIIDASESLEMEKQFLDGQKLVSGDRRANIGKALSLVSNAMRSEKDGLSNDSPKTRHAEEDEDADDGDKESRVQASEIEKTIEYVKRKMERIQVENDYWKQLNFTKEQQEHILHNTKLFVGSLTEKIQAVSLAPRTLCCIAFCLAVERELYNGTSPIGGDWTRKNLFYSLTRRFSHHFESLNYGGLGRTLHNISPVILSL